MANPQVQQGQCATFPIGSYGGQGTEGDWSITDKNGVLVATAANGVASANGYKASWDETQSTPPTVTVCVPQNALADTGYTVAWDTDNDYDQTVFDIIGGTATTKTINAAKQAFGTPPQTARLRATLTAAHAPVVSLSHSPDFTTRTDLPAFPAPVQDSTVSPPAWHYDLTLPSPVTDKYFHIVAASAAGTSDAVTLTDFRLYDTTGGTTGGDTTPPATPAGLVAQSASSASVSVSFTRNTESDLAGYQFTRNGAAFTPTLTLSATTASFTDSGLTTGMAYAYRVSAYDTSGNDSPFCAPATATPGSTAAAPTISIITPAPGDTGQGIIKVRVQADGGTGGIASVKLYVGGSLVDTLTSPTAAPDFYDLTWDTRPSGNGAFSLTATASDHAAPVRTATTAAQTYNVLNPGRLGTSYFYTAPLTPKAGATLAFGVPTLDIQGSDDPRLRRQLTLGYRLGNVTGNFETQYTTVLPNHLIAFPAGAGDTYSMAVKFTANYVATPFAFTEQIVKAVPYDTAHVLLWTTDNKIWTFDGISTPVLLLDATTVFLSGETMNDLCAFNGRVYLALAGGAAPLASRLYEYDPAASDVSYALMPTFASPIVALTAGTNLYLATAAGIVYQMTAGGSLSAAAGVPTAFPAGVARLLPIALAPTNTTPGIAVVLADGSVYDLDSTETTRMARIIFTPPDGTTTQTNGGAVAPDGKYLATGTAGNLFRLVSGAGVYAADFTAPGTIQCIATYAGTIFFGLGADGRLWGKTVNPAAHTLTYGSVTDPLPNVTSINVLFVLNGLLFLGTTGGASSLWAFAAPTADPNALFGGSVSHPSMMVEAFA